MTPLRRSYDVIVVGARCAGASTALLLARAGVRVLVVDRAPPERDVLSTHALMRTGVLQLHRWGVLEAIRAAGTPSIHTTTFHYGSDAIEVPIKPRNGVDALYAPRRSVLDRALADAAQAAGAEVVYGVHAHELVRDAAGRVRGLTIESAEGIRQLEAPMVVGADGLRSMVARQVEAATLRRAGTTAATVYAYFPDLENRGFHWHYAEGVTAGVIPTNVGHTCLFVCMPPWVLEPRVPIDAVYRRALRRAAPEVARRLEQTRPVGPFRIFRGAPGYLKQAWGPGWALVGDAGYFRDPITAHGISDALRDAELLARAIVAGASPSDLDAYQNERDRLSLGLFEATNAIAGFEWDLDSVRLLHRGLSQAMGEECQALEALQPDALALPVAS